MPGARALASALRGAAGECIIPLLRRQVRHLAQMPVQAAQTPVIVPLLTRQAAALPTEQSH